MSKSKTPRSDEANKEWAGNCHPCCVDADFARTLELERNEAMEAFQKQRENYIKLYEAVVGEGCVVGWPDPVQIATELRSQLTTAQQEKHQQQMQFLELYKLMPEIENQYIDRLLIHLRERLIKFNEQQQEIAIKNILIEEVREFTAICICECGEKMLDTDLMLFLSRYDSAMKGTK